ncbi:hypothetical protein V6X63_04395 [Spiribacter sp. 221]|uniref:hypothetical protein n=1 Tax=Spiribacter onubensis TaxID=3122420 RepID=UPI00349F633E
MPPKETSRERLRRQLARGIAYTTPILVAVTGAAAVHALISDIAGDNTPDPGAGAVPEATAPGASAATPEAMPEAAPEAAPEAGPEAVPEAMPEAVPEAAPEAMPEAVPEATPEAGSR